MMYKFIYFYILELRKKRNPDPKFDAMIFVWITQGVHIFFVLAVVKKVFEIQVPVFSEIPYYNKLLAMPFVAIWLIFTNYYYKKRSDQIVKSYAGRKVITWKNFIIVFSLLLIPLIVTIQLSKK